MGTVWELDFYSRPLLDEQNKKVWEVLLCESPTQVDQKTETLFRYTQFCPSTQVNSAWLSAAIQEAIVQASQPPERIRFFRQAMNNMISKACEDIGIPARISRRTFALNQWLQQRMQEVYPKMSGYQLGSNPSVAFASTNPQPLPDALLGEKWQFVSLEAAAFADMREWDIAFGESFPLGMVDLLPETLIPGLIIYSHRAVPLAAWMSGLELACLKLDLDPVPRLLLETGINDRWTLVNLSTAQMRTEAEGFEASKQQANQVHFLAIQSDPQSEAFAGFWLLQELDLT